MVRLSAWAHLFKGPNMSNTVATYVLGAEQNDWTGLQYRGEKGKP
jgi:hypothetical protein